MNLFKHQLYKTILLLPLLLCFCCTSKNQKTADDPQTILREIGIQFTPLSNWNVLPADQMEKKFPAYTDSDWNYKPIICYNCKDSNTSYLIICKLERNTNTPLNQAIESYIQRYKSKSETAVEFTVKRYEMHGITFTHIRMVFQDYIVTKIFLSRVTQSFGCIDIMLSAQNFLQEGPQIVEFLKSVKQTGNK